MRKLTVSIRKEHRERKNLFIEKPYVYEIEMPPHGISLLGDFVETFIYRIIETYQLSGTLLVDVRAEDDDLQIIEYSEVINPTIKYTSNPSTYVDQDPNNPTVFKIDIANSSLRMEE